MNDSSSARTGDRALVLGGAGSAGNAWVIGVIGVLAGLADAGVDVLDAERVIGTSAGATAAAQVTATSPLRLLDQIVSAPDTAPRDPAAGPPPGESHLQRTGRIIAESAGPEDMRRRLGAAAIALAAASPEAAGRWRATVAARLPHSTWPGRRLLITAVDAATGDPVIFDRDSGVDLVDAVAASCSSGLAYPIGDRQYIDGGYRSNSDNADLAAGSRAALVLSPFGGATRLPPGWGLDLASQCETLRADDTDVTTVFPDEDARAAFGDDVMSPRARRPAALAGFAQGRRAAAAVAKSWR